MAHSYISLMRMFLHKYQPSIAFWCWKILILLKLNKIFLNWNNLHTLFIDYYMNSMKLVNPLHHIELVNSHQRWTAFVFILGVNWLWHCGVTASFVVCFHEIKCNRMTSFMEFMITAKATWHYAMFNAQHKHNDQWWALPQTVTDL